MRRAICIVTDEELAQSEPTDTIVYGYDATWKDKLVSYDGQDITYDALGNPLSYRGMTLTWSKARELYSLKKSGITYRYRYDSDGMRTNKFLSNGTVTYQIESNLIVGEQKVDSTGALVYELEFLYDSSGNVLGMVYNGEEYYYEKNLQGDIVGLMDGTGTRIATYKYDSWGKTLRIFGSNAELGKINPFRYRSYYYDRETGFYYVSSRYYDPEVGRFISADTTDILEVQDDLYDKNLYAYCDNNPVMRVDSSGAVWHLAVGAAVGVATQLIADVGIGLATGSSFGEVMSSLSPVDYVSAAIGGAIAASGIGFAGAVVANAALGGTTYLANCSYKGVTANKKDFVASTVIGGVAGAIGGSGANGKNMRGVYSRSKQVINATKSTRKQAMYKAKVTGIKQNITKSTGKTFLAGIVSNVSNFFRRWLTKSNV